MESHSQILLLLATAVLSVGACPEEYGCTCSQTDSDYIVDCSSRDLETIPESIPHNVTQLNLSNNSLPSIENRTFENLADLRMLDLSHNLIEEIHTLGFEGLGSLQTLELRHNNLETLDKGQEILQPVENVIFIIEISNNNLHSLQHGLFERCRVLKYLGLANNMLSLDALEAINVPSGITNLDISGNPLGKIPYRIFHNLGAMTSLTIKNSSIETIDPNAFVDLKNSLEILDITSNEIRHIKREMFQPMISNQFTALTLSANQIVCDCGTKQFQDWLNELQPVVDEATCTSKDGTIYRIKDDDLSQFCKDQGGDPFPTPNPGLCAVDASLTLSLLAVDSHTAYLEHYQMGLPEQSMLYLQLRETVSQTVVENLQSTVADTMHDFGDLEENTGYSVCAVNHDCVVWTCLTFRTTSPSALSVTQCDNLALVIGLTAGGCVVFFIILLVVLILLYNASLISCVRPKHKSGPAGYHYDRRRSTKYGATVYGDYQAADDNNYEAIPTRTGSQLSRKYEMPDELPPTLAGTRVGPTEVLPAQLPPKKKPIHFIRDPNFLAQGTAAHGETYSEPVEPRDSTTSGSTASTSGSANHDRKGIPLPAIPESSLRRKQLAEPYLEPTPSASPERDWNWNGEPANQNISTIAHPQHPTNQNISTIAHAQPQSTWPHYEPQFPHNPSDRNTYLEPTDPADPDLGFDMTLNPNRQTADFTRGISLKFSNRPDSDPSTDTEHGSLSSGILLIPSKQDSNGLKASVVLPSKTGKKKKSKSRKKDRMSVQALEGDITDRSPTGMVPGLEKERGSIQFTDDIYLHIENEASKV